MKKRKEGIEIARGIASFMIVILHCLSFGGGLYIEATKVQYHFFWLLNGLCFCAVDVFGILSGYLGYDNQFRIKKVIKLWMTVLFYSVGILVLYLLYTRQALGGREVVKYFFPFISGIWWYFTDYVVVFLLAPFVNTLLNALNKDSAKYLLFLILILFCVLPVFASTMGNDEFVGVHGGYSMIWLLSCYNIGAYLKKFGFPKFIKNHPILLYLLSGGVSWGVFELLSVLHDCYGIYFVGNCVLMQYISITILLEAVSLIYACNNIEIKGAFGKKVTRVIGATSFGIYIVHTHPILKAYLFNGIKPKLEGSVFSSIGFFFGYAIMIWGGCMLVDWTRYIVGTKMVELRSSIWNRQQKK